MVVLSPAHSRIDSETKTRCGSGTGPVAPDSFSTSGRADRDPRATAATGAFDPLSGGLRCRSTRRRRVLSAEPPLEASEVLVRVRATGICGTLTTFSTMQLELFNMVDAGEPALASVYLGASLAVGYLALRLGIAIEASRPDART